MSCIDFQGVQWAFESWAVNPLGDAIKDGSIEARYRDYPDALAELKNGYALMAKAVIYAERIDKLLQEDDDEAGFVERLRDNLAHFDAMGGIRTW